MPDGSIVRPYGDTTGDGMVQVSFTLPIPHDKKAEGAAEAKSGVLDIPTDPGAFAAFWEG